jgi:hypothetical protein
VTLKTLQTSYPRLIPHGSEVRNPGWTFEGPVRLMHTQLTSYGMTAGRLHIAARPDQPRLTLSRPSVTINHHSYTARLTDPPDPSPRPACAGPDPVPLPAIDTLPR